MRCAARRATTLLVNSLGFCRDLGALRLCNERKRLLGGKNDWIWVELGLDGAEGAHRRACSASPSKRHGYQYVLLPRTGTSELCRKISELQLGLEFFRCDAELNCTPAHKCSNKYWIAVSVQSLFSKNEKLFSTLPAGYERESKGRMFLKIYLTY